MDLAGRLPWTLAPACACACLGLLAGCMQPAAADRDLRGVPDAATTGGPARRAVTNSTWIDAGRHFPATGKGSFSVATVPVTRSACNLAESAVYHLSLVHSQDEDTRWELRLGKGSQIYSIQTSLGELIGAQECGPPAGPWIDRVLQAIVVDSAKNSADRPYFIHQAGTYEALGQGLDSPFFSPLLDAELDAASQTYHTLVWPQQAHVYASIPWRSTVLLQQDVRDAGDGVIEITYVYENFGGDAFDFIDLPWSGFARLPAPSYALSTPDLGWKWDMPATSWDQNLIGDNDTAGWMAIVQRQELSARGLGVLFGKGPGHNPAAARVRFGAAGSEDLTVLENLPGVTIAPGQTFFYRFYLVVGLLNPSIHPYGNQLAGFVQYGPLSFDLASAGLVDPCVRAPGVLPCRFYGLDRPVPGARPLLLLRDLASGKPVLSTDPYALSDRPYLGKSTGYLGLVGWGVGGAAAPGAEFVRLSTVLPDPAVYPDPAHGSDVWVVAR